MGFHRNIGFNLHDHVLKIRDVLDGKSLTDLQDNETTVDALRYSGIQHSSVEDEPIPEMECIGASIGDHNIKRTEAALEKIFEKSEDQGIS